MGGEQRGDPLARLERAELHDVGSPPGQARARGRTAAGDGSRGEERVHRVADHPGAGPGPRKAALQAPPGRLGDAHDRRRRLERLREVGVEAEPVGDRVVAGPGQRREVVYHLHARQRETARQDPQGTDVDVSAAGHERRRHRVQPDRARQRRRRRHHLDPPLELVEPDGGATRQAGQESQPAIGRQTADEPLEPDADAGALTEQRPGVKRDTHRGTARGSPRPGAARPRWRAPPRPSGSGRRARALPARAGRAARRRRR